MDDGPAQQFVLQAGREKEYEKRPLLLRPVSRAAGSFFTVKVRIWEVAANDPVNRAAATLGRIATWYIGNRSQKTCFCIK